MEMSLSKLWETVKDREAWSASVHGGTKSQIQLSDRTTATIGPLASHIIHSLTQTVCHGPSMLFDPHVLGDTKSEIKNICKSKSERQCASCGGIGDGLYVYLLFIH